MADSMIGVERSAMQKPEQRRKPWLRHPFRRKNLRGRVLIAIATGAAVLMTADPSWRGAVWGLPLILAGVGLRGWATGHLVKTSEFIVSGPYAYLRHPLYAGTLLIGSGFCLVAGGRVAPLFLPAFLLVFFAYYFPRKNRIESERLENLYGEHFRAYREAVRPLLPSLRPWHPIGQHVDVRWQRERFRENDELGTVLAVAAALLALFALGLLR